MKENVITTKSFAFALRVIKLYQYLRVEKKEYILGKQLMRSRTSIGAMVREAEQAESRPDFIQNQQLHKKKPTKQNIGLNFYINQDIWINNSTSLFSRILQK